MANVELDEDISAEVDRKQLTLNDAMVVQLLRNTEELKKKVEEQPTQPKSRPSGITVTARRRDG